MEISKRLIPVNFTKGGNAKLGVVIHTMVGNLDGTDSWFRNPASGVSSHYGIDLDGSRVFQWVEENDIAQAQGLVSVPTFKLTVDRPGINPNTYLISIECADGNNPAGADRSKQIPVIVELVRDICKRNNIPMDRQHLCGHREIRSTKTCPGNLDVDEIVRQVAVQAEHITDDQKRALEFINANKGTSNFEGAVRQWLGAFNDKPVLENKAKQLDGLIAKWVVQWNLASSSGLVEVEAEMAKLMPLEEVAQEYRESIEQCVGTFPDDLRLLEAHTTVRKQIDDLSSQVSALQTKLNEAKVPSGYKFLKSWTLTSLLFKLYKRTVT